MVGYEVYVIFLLKLRIESNTKYKFSRRIVRVLYWPLFYLSSTYMVLLTWTLFSVCLSMGVECSETGNQKLES